MRRLCIACVGGFALLAAVALAACGGDDVTFTGADDSGAADGTLGDGAGGDDSATADAGIDTATPGSDAGGDGGCASRNSKQACEDCCKTTHPEGAAVFGQALLSCGCQKNLCGPTDAGADADAGLLGSGACTQLCQNPDAGASGRCAACIEQTVARDGGACFTSVSGACAASAACIAYFACTTGCK